MSTHTARTQGNGRTSCAAICACLALVGGAPAALAAEKTANADVRFLIGTPDASGREFGRAQKGLGAIKGPARNPILPLTPAPLPQGERGSTYRVDTSRPEQWPAIHPGPRDAFGGNRTHTLAIEYLSPAAEKRPLYLILGTAGSHPVDRSWINVAVNGHDLPRQLAPLVGTDPELLGDPALSGEPVAITFEMPAGLIAAGENRFEIRLDDGSWIVYDYVALAERPWSVRIAEPPTAALREAFLSGPMGGAEEIVFAVRSSRSEHWYANIGYYAEHREIPLYGEGGRLCRLNLRTRQLAKLVDDPRGGVRDPQVSYDGQKILFSYRPGGTEHYHLYEINADGSGMRRLTDGPFDDIEPNYLPDGDIVFVSTRCKRWVNCWITQVAVLHRCRGDGSEIEAISSNNEHDNTPWTLPGGQILYTRWEYVDRSQLHFHHLWSTSPDGARQTVFFGNMRAGKVLIDAKPIPGSAQIVATASPGHGTTEHTGAVVVLDPRTGPDRHAALRTISVGFNYRDPWAFSATALMAARHGQIVLLDEQGRIDPVFELPAEDRKARLECHEPRLLAARPREPVVAPHGDGREPVARVLVMNAAQGRNMEGVRPGEIKKLLVLETLPKPVNFSGGMEPLSYGGTFTLERVVGTIPVEPDGSAYAELPALRSLFFVALDERDLAVKRMQSFVTFMPGETTACLGCHEPRTAAPPHQSGQYLALRRPPSRVEPIAGAPDVLDFPRDIQPMLDRHCVRCHDFDRPDGGLVLSGDRGPIYSLAYFAITARGLVADGRNGLGNRPPRTIGSAASRLLALCDGSHYDAQISDHERTLLRLWIETGAAYPGTYAALGTGMIGGFGQLTVNDRLQNFVLDRSDDQSPAAQAAMQTIGRRCDACHHGPSTLPLSVCDEFRESASDRMGAGPWAKLSPSDSRRQFSRHLLYNLSRPEKSPLLLAPLAKAAGGWQRCKGIVFADRRDADYQTILRAIDQSREKLAVIKRFDMPGFRPRAEYVREMQRFGVLSAELPAAAPIDPYAADRAYWASLWPGGARP